MKLYLKKRLIIFIMGVAYLILLYLNKLNLFNWLPPCPIKAFTNTECFGCGTNRALLALLNGEFTTAFSLNPIGTFLPLVLIVFFIFDYQSFKNQYINPKQS